MKQNFQKQKILTLEFVYKMINTKYEVYPTPELGYLAQKKRRHIKKSWKSSSEHFLDDFHWKSVEWSWIFRKFPKFVQLWRAVSPISVNIFSKFEKILKGLCINFKTSLKRSKTGSIRKSYSRFIIGNFRKFAFTPPVAVVVSFMPDIVW